MAYLNLQNVSLSCDGNRIFEDINLTTEQGEKVILVGRNGAGNSTLLKLSNSESTLLPCVMNTIEPEDNPGKYFTHI